MDAIGRTLKPLWRARNEFQIREVGDHTLLFVFETETDAKRVLDQEPWSFDKHLILLQRYDYSIPVKQLRFTKITFWVQIHGLPLRLLDPETAIELGETLGEVITDEAEKEMVGGDFVRVRVRIDVSKPLSRGRRVVLDEETEIWISFKYEKLSNFCYCCGMVTHDERECEKRLAEKEPHCQVQQEYGAWLRAIPFNPGRSPFTTVLGMGDGLGGTTKQTPRKKSGVEDEITPVASQGGPTPEVVGNASATVDNHSDTHMETTDIGEALAQNLSPSLSPVIRVINSTSISSPIDNSPHDFESQIAKIDSALKKFDSHSTSTTTLPSATLSQSQSEGNIPKINAVSLEVEIGNNPSHVTTEPLNPSHVINYTIPHDPTTLRTWKRIARSNTAPEYPIQSSVLHKRNRELEEEVHPELPRKKVLVSKDEDTELSMAEAAVQPRQEP